MSNWRTLTFLQEHFSSTADHNSVHSLYIFTYFQHYTSTSVSSWAKLIMCDWFVFARWHALAVSCGKLLPCLSPLQSGVIPFGSKPKDELNKLCHIRADRQGSEEVRWEVSTETSKNALLLPHSLLGGGQGFARTRTSVTGVKWVHRWLSFTWAGNKTCFVPEKTPLMH